MPVLRHFYLNSNWEGDLPVSQKASVCGSQQKHQAFIAQLSPLRGEMAFSDNVPSSTVGSCQDPAFPLQHLAAAASSRGSMAAQPPS